MIREILIAFSVAAFITLLARLKHLIKYPKDVERHENGKINWLYCIFVNGVELLIGGVVGIAVGIVFEYYHLLEGNMLMLAIGMSGLAAGKIFESAQNRLNKKVEESENDFVF